MKQHHGRGRRHGRPGGWQQAGQPEAGDAAAWFCGRPPDAWFAGDPTVVVDREEITVIGKLPDPEGSAKDESEAHAAGRASRFREETRSERMNIADEAQNRYGRKVSWGVEVGDEQVLFTHIAVPVMTRLKQPERQGLDTLVDAGVARSRGPRCACRGAGALVAGWRITAISNLKARVISRPGDIAYVSVSERHVM